MNKTLFSKLIVTFLVAFSFFFLFTPSQPTYANQCSCDTTTGKCEGDAGCFPSVRNVVCGSNNDVCDLAQQRYACENVEVYTKLNATAGDPVGVYLCPYNDGLYEPNRLNAEKGAWSEVFRRCFCSTGDLIQQILNIAVYSISIIALFLLVLGGIKYITSQNNPDKITDAKEMLLAAIIGMVLVLFSVTLIALLNGQLNPNWGIDLLNIP